MGSSAVIVVGAGPTGLMLAGDLARAGVAVTVIDRLAEPSPHPKANGVVGQAARLLRHRGVLARLGRTTMPPTPAFQFGGIGLDLTAVPEAPLHGMAASQQELERALEERAVELGVGVRRSCEAVDLVETADRVVVRVRSGGRDEELVAPYVVGCDGAHSRVRELAGIEFSGVTDSTVVSRAAEVVIPGSSPAPGTAEIEVPGAGRLGLYRWNRTPRGAWAMLPRPNGTLLVSAMEWEDGNRVGDAEDVPVSVPEVANALERVLGAAIPMLAPSGPGPHQLRRWRGRNTRIAETYRRGRILLAGDAAHVHNAVGAPGLNVGLQDAACLAWRLAGALRGAPELLDGYQLERRPAAERVATHSQAQTLLLSPGDGVSALRALLSEWVEEPALLARLARLLEGSDLRYPTAGNAHPLTGRFVPELGEIDRHLGDPRPTLVDLGAGPSERPPGAAVVAAAVADPPAGALLVRPDGYVAWASDESGPAEEAELRRIVAALTGAELS